MRRLGRQSLAWGLLAVTTTCLVGTVLMPDRDWPLNAIVFIGLAIELTAVAGAVVASRRPDNAVGWLLLGIGLCFASGLLATQYANRALIDAPGSLPGGVIAAWFQSWMWGALLTLLPLLLLLFPTGRLLSRRWRPVAWAIVGASSGFLLANALRPGGFETFPGVSNPLGVDALRGVNSVVFAVNGPIAAASFVASVASLIIRFRRSRGEERQQLKWFVYAAIAAIALTLTNPFTSAYTVPGLRLNVSFALPVLGLTLLPLAIGAAVLRYRLFEIDRIVSRTVAYAGVTALLASAYGGLVFLFGLLLRPIAGASDLAIAASVLVVAALFRPVRRRVQSAVDRRFNRARYDAARTIETFGARLRDQIDIDALATEVEGTVHRTMQPSSVSLWVRGQR
jgi:hypothetical protein